MARRNLDLAAAIALAALAAATAATTGSAPARAVPGSLLALVVPGYALSVMLFPERHRDLLERALLALGLSISVSVIGAVALDETPAGLTARAWCVALACVTLAASGAAAWRRARLRPAGTAASTGARVASLSPARLALTCAALALVVASLVLARQPASHVQGFTTLWALPKDEARGAFAVGVKSDELRTTSYVLTAVSGTDVVLRRRVTLRPGESWSTTATRTPSIAKVLEVSLAKAARPETAYRRVHLALGAFGG